MHQIHQLYFIDDSDDEFFMSSLFFRNQKIQLEIIHFPDFDAFFAELMAGKVQDPDKALFLIDMNLTVMKGTDGVKLMRSQDKWPDMIVCICSGSEDPADIKNALEAGADAFLPKPLDKACLQLLCEKVADLQLKETSDGEVCLFRDGA